MKFCTRIPKFVLVMISNFQSCILLNRCNAKFQFKTFKILVVICFGIEIQKFFPQRSLNYHIIIVNNLYCSWCISMILIFFVSLTKPNKLHCISKQSCLHYITAIIVSGLCFVCFYLSMKILSSEMVFVLFVFICPWKFFHQR